MTDNVVPVGAFVLVEHFEHRERVEVYVRPERFVTRPNRGQVEEGEDSVGALLDFRERIGANWIVALQVIVAAVVVAIDVGVVITSADPKPIMDGDPCHP